MRKLTTDNLQRTTDKGFTLIEILVVIGIIAILAAIVLIAINPARQFAQANNTQRESNTNAILNAIGQYMVDNNGELPSEITTSAQNISSGGADLCGVLVGGSGTSTPSYIPALPVDPTDGDDDGNGDGQVDSGECSGSYDTAYTVVEDGDGRVTVAAPQAQLGEDISVTR